MHSYGYVSSGSTERVFSGIAGYGTATGSLATQTSITVAGISYSLLAFTTVGGQTLTVTQGGLFDVLMIGGGGAAGNCNFRNPTPVTFGASGGGGGGGVIGGSNGQTLTIFLAGGTYTIDVGRGGVPYGDANNYSYYWGMPGRPSRIAASATQATSYIVEALGGGGGAGAGYGSSSEYSYFIPRDGAQGGGSTWSTEPYISSGLSYDYTRRAQGQGAYPGHPRGRDGGGGSVTNDTSSAYGGGGGGAALNAVGGNGTSGVGGTGGAGLDVAFWIGSASPYYIGAGGSGGGVQGGGPAAFGGVAGRSGSANGNNGVQPGAGGGGTVANNANRQGGEGAPGGVWIRYRV